MSQPLTAAERSAATRQSLGATGASLILYILPVPLLGKAVYELLWQGRFGGLIPLVIDMMKTAWKKSDI